ncbi:MAG: DUF2851 family protein [Alistipes sp.]|nr:DUF2851 family protein [Alistipes sp.]
MADEQHSALFERLKADAEKGAPRCGLFLASLDELFRTEIYTSLLYERLERKMTLVEELYRESGEDWHQTFYLLYFRTLGDSQNQAAYLELARRVPYRIVLRERLTPHGIEAMLFGVSGLLDLYPHDEYTLMLRREYLHLEAKYQLQTMDVGAWSLREIRPANHPALRLAQASEFFRQDDFIFDRMLACSNEEEVERLFCIEADRYWRNHYVPADRQTSTRPKRIGIFKAHILGINLVAMLQFAYGSYTGKEALRDKAFSLLETLPAEDNRYIRTWQNRGIEPRDSFETQALLQLSTAHCLKKGCDTCPVGRRIAREASR